MSPRLVAWGRRHSVGLVIAAAIVYAAGIVGAFMFAASAVQREANERVAAADRQDAQIAVHLARNACRARNSFRDALDEVFTRIDELIADGGSSVELATLFADLIDREDCTAIGSNIEVTP